MRLKYIVIAASAAYPDGLIAAEYWDFKRNCPRKNPNGGDTLALFIANEIADTYDSDASGEEQIQAVLNALSMARSDLAAVGGALTAEMEKRHGGQNGRE